MFAHRLPLLAPQRQATTRMNLPVNALVSRVWPPSIDETRRQGKASGVRRLTAMTGNRYD